MAKRLKGLYRDCNPIDQPPDTYRYANNALLTEQVGAIMSDYGLTQIDLSEKLGNQFIIIGYTLINNGRVVLFSVNQDETESKISILNTDSTLKKVSDNPELNLNFKPNSSIDSTYRINKKGEAIVYWTDGINPPKFINVDNVQNVTSGNRYNLFNYVEKVPKINLLSISDSGGSLTTGVFYFAARYIDYEGNQTNFLSVSNSIYLNDNSLSDQFLNDGAPPNTPTNKSINLEISNIDSYYSYLELAVVKKEGGVFVPVKILPKIIITKTGNQANNITYKHTGSESYIEGSLDEILVDNASYETAETIEQLDNNLYLGNLTSAEDLGYQKYANNIKLQAVTLEKENFLTSSESSYRDPEFSFKFKGYQRDEVYAFYISFILNDGSESKAYHIPGRAAIDVGGINENSPIADSSSDLDRINGDFSSSAVDNIDSDAKRFHFINDAHPNWNTGYWENENETYPNNEDWEIWDVNDEGVGFDTGTSLKNSKVRHHRMPDHIKEPITQNYNSANVLLIKLHDIKIPLDIKEKVKSIKIYYAKPDNSNKRVLDQSFTWPLFVASDDSLLGTSDLHYISGLPPAAETNYRLDTNHRDYISIRTYGLMPFYSMRSKEGIGDLTYLKKIYVPLGYSDGQQGNEKNIYFFNKVNVSEADWIIDPDYYYYSDPEYNTIKNFVDSDRSKSTILPVSAKVYVPGLETIVELKSKGFQYNACMISSESQIMAYSNLNATGNNTEIDWGGNNKQYSFISNLMSHKKEVYNSFDFQELVWTGFEDSNLDKYDPSLPSYTAPLNPLATGIDEVLKDIESTFTLSTNNLVQSSSDFGDTSNWIYFNASAINTGDGPEPYNSNAYSIGGDGSNANGFCYVQQTISGLTAGATYTASCYFKSGASGYASIFIDDYDGSSNAYTIIDLQAGVIDNSLNGTGTIVDSLDNEEGWLRASFTWTQGSSDTEVILKLAVLNSNNFIEIDLSNNSEGDPVNSVIMFGPQVELGNTATTYESDLLLLGLKFTYGNTQETVYTSFSSGNTADYIANNIASAINVSSTLVSASTQEQTTTNTLSSVFPTYIAPGSTEPLISNVIDSSAKEEAVAVIQGGQSIGEQIADFNLTLPNDQDVIYEVDNGTTFFDVYVYESVNIDRDDYTIRYTTNGSPVTGTSTPLFGNTNLIRIPVSIPNLPYQLNVKVKKFVNAGVDGFLDSSTVEAFYNLVASSATPRLYYKAKEPGPKTIKVEAVTTYENFDLSGFMLNSVRDRNLYINGGESTSGVTDMIGGGDIFLSMHSMRISVRAIKTNNDPVYKSIIAYLVESRDNVEYRHSGLEDYEIYHTGSSLDNSLAVLEGNHDNYYGYNPDYSSLQNIKTAIPYGKINISEDTEFKTRVIRSKTTNPGDEFDSFRTFLSNDFKDFTYNRGELVKLNKYANNLILHMERSLMLTRGKEDLATGDARVFVGSGDIFSVEPNEIITSEYGTGGLQNINHSILTEEGYFFVDQEEGSIYSLTGQGLANISDIGMRNEFEKILPWNLSKYNLFNPYNADKRYIGINFGYDKEHSRIFLVKRDVTPSQDFTSKLSNGLITIGEDGQFYENGNKIDYNSSYFTPDNVCLSYVPQLNAWVSYHSYIPFYYISNNKDLYSFSNLYNDSSFIYKHNNKSFPLDIKSEQDINSYEYNNLNYYESFLNSLPQEGLTLFSSATEGGSGVLYSHELIDSNSFPFEFGFVENRAPNESKMFTTLSLITSSVSSDGVETQDETFDSFRIYNNKQDSGTQTIVPFQSLVSQGNARKIEGTWNINKFRNLLTTGGIDTNKLWYQQDRFIGNYVEILLTYYNSNNNFLYLTDSEVGVRKSLRWKDLIDHIIIEEKINTF